MKTQAARRPSNKRPTRSAKIRKYQRQTAHVEARRDGKPLIFGWGGHLSQKEKLSLQRRAIWSLVIVFAVIIVALLVGFWININIVIPNSPLVTVNGEKVPQADYRKMVAVKAQLRANDIEALQTKSDNLKKQIDPQQKVVNDLNKQVEDLQNKLKSSSADAKPDLEKQLNEKKAKQDTEQKKLNDLQMRYNAIVQNDIPNQKQLYTQQQVGAESTDLLLEDILIRQWLADPQHASLSNQINPTPQMVDKALNDFKQGMPKSLTYDKFLQDNHLSNEDVRNMLTVKVRQDNMKKYQADQVTSPSYQVQASHIILDTPEAAKKVLDQLKKGANFAKLAKEQSKDSDTKDKGGELGWMIPGQYSIDRVSKVGVAGDLWLFDPKRTVNEVSPVINDGGTYRILKITGIEKSRNVDEKTLKNVKDNAYTVWVLKEKARLGDKISQVDDQMKLDSANMPSNLPVSPPTQQSPYGG
ncbi:parvulin-like peptidyl-prolyl cis-trans isomerase protein [Thermosporothrix hazakensis]|jgi:parvulin-like peptidyl-prolyl isomerase|uniref:Parvulin-like peptidyl-prolyl cis-trans isomerase protein n=1 Tax=Thermosporothrix hazakensis TaxID=644383 RepID=A0A326TZR7_THEHA|nr:peptidylprolyl isomerase [Thermosporothrix hazakensis]PZW23310.1 parvulin-like peptidyl-prolyl cis-trans isomerase protein [Thermosporothrix hazakensis]GCE47763.1 hypothetical protein KTH_26320 [Thermosporothrix hazakensis]